MTIRNSKWNGYNPNNEGTFALACRNHLRVYHRVGLGTKRTTTRQYLARENCRSARCPSEKRSTTTQRSTTVDSISFQHEYLVAFLSYDSSRNPVGHSTLRLFSIDSPIPY